MAHKAVAVTRKQPMAHKAVAVTRKQPMAHKAVAVTRKQPMAHKAVAVTRKQPMAHKAVAVTRKQPKGCKAVAAFRKRPSLHRRRRVGGPSMRRTSELGSAGPMRWGVCTSSGVTTKSVRVKLDHFLPSFHTRGRPSARGSVSEQKLTA